MAPLERPRVGLRVAERLERDEVDFARARRGNGRDEVEVLLRARTR